jgi:DNA-binding response OmpR family regulator
MKILILEDDAALCRGIELALKAPDREFTLCFSLAEARTKLQDGAPDLFILDTLNEKKISTPLKI